MAGFLSLSQTGHNFGLFKPNGTGVAKKSPRAEGGRGEVNSPLQLINSNTQTTRVGGFCHVNLNELVPRSRFATKLGTKWLKFQIDAKVGRKSPRGRIWSIEAKVRPQYTYRVRLSRSGRRFGGEGAQGGGGWGGGKPPPVSLDALTRRPQGSAD